MIAYSIIFLFACLAAPAIWKDKQLFSRKRQIFFLIFILLGFFAGLRGENVDYLDYSFYKEAFFHVQGIQSGAWYQTVVDPTFIVLANFSHAIFDSRGFYVLIFIYAILSLLIKYKALLISKVDLGLATVFLLSSYLYLHEFIQIRAGLAISLIMLSASLCSANRRKAAFLTFCLAVLTHGQALAGFPIFLIGSKSVNQKYYDILLVLAFFASTTMGEGIDVYRATIFAAIGADDFARMKYLTSETASPTLSGLALIHLTTYIFLRFLGRNSLDGKYYYFLKIYSLGLIYYWMTNFSGVLSYRLIEQFSVFFVFAISFLPASYKYKYTLAVSHSMVLFYFYMIERSLVNSYKLIVF